MQRGGYQGCEIIVWACAEHQWAFQGQEITLEPIRPDQTSLHMCAHACLSIEAWGRLGVGFRCFTNLPVGENSRGEKPASIPSPSGQPWGWTSNRPETPSLSQRGPMRLLPEFTAANPRLFPASCPGSLALFSSPCQGETWIQPFGEGGHGAKAFMPPGVPFCHPSCFAQQPRLRACCPWAQPPEFDNGGATLCWFT